MSRSWALFYLGVVVAAIGATLLWANPAWPQQMQCLPVAVAERALMETYGEQQVAVGIADGKSIRLYANSATRTWTVLAANGRGAACPVVSGTDLDFAKPPPAGRAS